MDRKYAGDYTVEEVLLPNGSRQIRRVYRGVSYRFQEDDAVICRLQKRIRMAVAAVVLLLLPLFCLNTGLGRTLHVLLPAALTILPLYGLWSAAWHLKRNRASFTKEQRDKTDGRIRNATVGLTFLLGMSCAGCWISGFAPEERVIVTTLHLALLVSICLLTQRKKAATVPVET